MVTMMRLWIGLLVLLAPCLPMLSGEQSAAASGAMAVIARPAAPHSESVADMMRRDRSLARQRPASPPAARPEPLGIPGGPKQTPEADGSRHAPPGGDGGFGIHRKESDTGAPQSVARSFAGISLADQFNDLGSGSIPPDTMGAIGPDHFIEVINTSVAIYNRTGTRLSHVSLNSFFTVNSGGVTFPRGGAFDPRVVYDRRSGRFFALAVERGNPSGSANDIVFTVSRTSDATGLWDKYVIPVGEATSGGVTFFTDFPTLGVDDNGVYMGMTIFPSAGAPFSKIAAVAKAPLIAASPSLPAVFAAGNITDLYSSPQPALNHDPVAAGGRAWIVSSSTTLFANVHYRTVTWSGGAPTLSGTTILSTPGFGPVRNAPAQGSIEVNAADDRLQMAVIRNGRLWTCRNVGVNSTGGSSGSDRTGCEWLELNVTGAAASLVQSGRVFDTAGVDPRFYYYPSLVVSGQGHVAMGYSGSKSTEFIGAYASGRLASDAPGTMQAVMQLQPGLAIYERTDGVGRNRWGDYSYTSLDPNDDMSIWTIQEHASATEDIWATRIFHLLAPPPTLNNVNVSVARGTMNATLQLTGTGLYDPGSEFPNRLTVSLTGGNPNGISNLRVQFNNAGSATVLFDVAADAQEGPRSLTLTNPDGQSVTLANAVTITAGGGGLLPSVFFSSSAVTVTEGGSATLTATLSASSLVPVTVDYTTGDGSAVAGSDYAATSGKVTFDPGQTSRAISVGTTPDRLLEDPETFTVTLSNPVNATLGNPSSATVTITDDRAVTAPSGLTAAVVAGPQVVLNWLDNSANEQGFQIERQSPGGSFLPIGSVGADTTTFADASVMSGFTYAYRVVAFNATGPSLPSNTAQANLADPGVLRVTPPKLKFPRIRAGETVTGQVRVENVGDGPLSVTVHEPPAPFSVTENGGSFSLQPGEVRMVTVTFAPLVKGKAKAELLIVSDGGEADVLLRAKAKKAARSGNKKK